MLGRFHGWSPGSASVPLADANQSLTEECKVMVMEWYSWVGIVGLVVILVGYKLYKDKTMT